MKNQNLNKGKKLDKRALRSITGGLIRCINPLTKECMATGPQCAETVCRFVLEPVDPWN